MIGEVIALGGAVMGGGWVNCPIFLETRAVSSLRDSIYFEIFIYRICPWHSSLMNQVCPRGLEMYTVKEHILLNCTSMFLFYRCK